MQTKRISPGGFVALLTISVIAGLFLYLRTLGQGFEAPDLLLIDPAAGAGRSLPMDQVWLAPLPAERPDLGAYRPAQGMLLKYEYSETAAAEPKTFRTVSLLLFCIFCFASTLLAARLIGVDRAGSVHGIFLAGGLAALHPMAGEAVLALGAQGALLSAAAWALALAVYQLSIEGRVPLWLLAIAIAILYFIAGAAHEIGLLLPLALLALDAFPVPPPHAEGAPARPAPPFASRALALALPIGLVAIGLLALRVMALGGALGATAPSASLGDDGLPARLVSGFSYFGIAVLRLVFPWAPTFFHSPRYDPPHAAMTALGGFLFAVSAGALVLMRAKRPRECRALALTLVPLLACFQLIPLSAAFAERWLIFALPGFAALAGGLLALAVPESTRRGLGRAPAWALAAAAIALVFCGGVSWMRAAEWSDSAKLWEAEAARHPADPAPVAFQMMDLINKPKEKRDLKKIDELSARAIELAKPPDADLVYQSLAVLHLSRRNLQDALPVIQRARQAPGPHVPGYYSLLGQVAKRLGDSLGTRLAAADEPGADLASKLFEQELAEHPRDFNALYSMTEVLAADAKWPETVQMCHRALREAPSHMRPRVLLNYSRALKEIGQLNNAVAALAQALREDPGFAEGYIAQAKLFIERGEYVPAEQTLALGRERALFGSQRDLIATHVESLEKQGRREDAYDFLADMSRQYPADLSFQIYAASYLVDRGQFQAAMDIYRKALGANPRNPDALVGMGRIALERDGNTAAARQQWRAALAAAPRHAEAAKRLKDLEDAEAKKSGGVPPAAPAGTAPAPPAAPQASAPPPAGAPVQP